MVESDAQLMGSPSMQREKNIQRNNAVLLAMGIATSAEDLLAAYQKKRRKITKTAKAAVTCEPSRSSHRLAFKAKPSRDQNIAPSTDEGPVAPSGKHRVRHTFC